MRIAFVTSYDASDILNWSGVAVHMSRAFEHLGHSVELIGALRNNAALPSLVKRAGYAPFGRRYLRDRDPTLLRSYARQVERRLAASDCDLVVSAGTLPIAYVRTEKPLVFWTDITFAGMVDFYPEFSHLPARTIREGNAAEQAALSASTLSILSSEWAARSTIANYEVDPANVRVVPFGANVSAPPTRADVEQMIATRSREHCTLLFLGVDWKRKGGDTAFAVTEALNANGVPTELLVCGAEPPPEVRASPNVTWVGFVNKATPQGRAQFNELLARVHFMILPTRAEAFGIAMCEASAFGVPSLVTEVGGTGGAVTSGVNGELFDLAAPVSEWRDCVAALWSDRDRYRELAMRSFGEFSERLNWEAGCSAVVEMTRERVGGKM